MSETFIVSDTSPLNYLVLIGLVELLPKLASDILIPPAVAGELIHPRTPLSDRQWIAEKK
jgi:predicted nucleic acid-binding protein